VPTVSSAGDDADAISAPTALSYNDAVISGAAYTCFTLWHWANGEMNAIIREKTVKACDQQDLVRYLTGTSEMHIEFALHEVIDRKAFDQSITDAVVDVVRRGGTDLAKIAIRYLRMASIANRCDVYFRTIEASFAAADAKKRVVFLTSLSSPSARASAQIKAPTGFYDRISRALPQLKTYYEVHMLLSLIDACGACSEQVITHALPLLEHENFFTARRVYWFLKDKQLQPDQQKKIASFREEHKDRLL
jgi:hypothetical protein